MVERIKIVTVGNPGVGKTSIINAFCEPGQDLSTVATMGVNLKHREVLGRNGTVELELSDTAGQEKYAAIVPMYTRSANVILLVFDVTQRQSLEDLQSIWLPVISQSPQDCRRILVGNKSDLQGEVQTNELEHASMLLGAVTEFTVSAKTRYGIEELFQWIARNDTVSRDQTYFKDVTPEGRLEARNEKGCCLSKG
jgi:small GTP-binding protein